MNHHSNLKCGFGFERCLKRLQSYSYRLRVLDRSGNPLTDWSNVLATRSYDWPAHVNLAEPFPLGPYPHTEEVTLKVQDTFGQGLRLEWTLIPYSGATYTLISGCQSGSYTSPSVHTCTIRIRYDGAAFNWSGNSKLAKLAPQPSVDVRVRGTDDFGYSASDGLSLIFENSCAGEICGPDEKELPDNPDGPEDPR